MATHLVQGMSDLCAIASIRVRCPLGRVPGQQWVAETSHFLCLADTGSADAGSQAGAVVQSVYGGNQPFRSVKHTRPGL
jgi:hypothetical protein